MFHYANTSNYEKISLLLPSFKYMNEVRNAINVPLLLTFFS